MDDHPNNGSDWGWHEGRVAPRSHPRRTCVAPPRRSHPPYPPVGATRAPPLGRGAAAHLGQAMTDKLSTMFRVGRYTCSITLQTSALQGGIACIETSWAPDKPIWLTKSELEEYR